MCDSIVLFTAYAHRITPAQPVNAFVRFDAKGNDVASADDLICLWKRSERCGVCVDVCDN
ncbi:MAG TPA: hypothetical protein VMG98_10350 [Verrucomicrobiae bacterium]|nr:hypothetical protein [Verrucomicrobiae bacterium]